MKTYIYNNQSVQIADRCRQRKSSNNKSHGYSDYYKISYVDIPGIIDLVPAGQFNRIAKCNACGVTAGRCKCNN